MKKVLIESILMELMLADSETVTCLQVKNNLEANDVMEYVSNKPNMYQVQPNMYQVQPNMYQVQPNMYQVQPRDLQFMFSHKGKTHAVKIVVMQQARDYYRICSNQFSHCFMQYEIDLETKVRLVHRLRIFPCNAYEYFSESIRRLNTDDLKELYDVVMAKQEAKKLLQS